MINEEILLLTYRFYNFVLYYNIHMNDKILKEL